MYVGYSYPIPTIRDTARYLIFADRCHGDHLSGNPGNVREYDSYQGNVREKSCPEKLPKTVLL